MRIITRSVTASCTCRRRSLEALTFCQSVQHDDDLDHSKTYSSSPCSLNTGIVQFTNSQETAQRAYIAIAM